MWVLGFELESSFKHQLLLTGESFFQVLECFALFLFDFLSFPPVCVEEMLAGWWFRGGVGGEGWGVWEVVLYEIERVVAGLRRFRT